jgi:hypothetical protein
LDLVLIQEVGDIASIQGGFPPFTYNIPFNLETLVFPYAVLWLGWIN